MQVPTTANLSSEERKALKRKALAEKVEREKKRAEKRAIAKAAEAEREQRKADRAARIAAELEAEEIRKAHLAEYRAKAKTIGAARVAAVMERVAKVNARVSRLGDPLNLLPENARAARVEDRARAKRGGKKTNEPEKEAIFDPSGNKVNVVSKGFSLRGYQEHLVRAAERFAQDWKIAYSGGVKAASFTPKVDGSGAGIGPHAARIDAQRRLAKLREQMGEEAWLYALAAVIHGYSPKVMNSKGGGHAATISVNVKHALHVIAAFYGSARQRRDPMIDFLTKLIEEGEREADLSSANGSARR